MLTPCSCDLIYYINTSHQRTSESACNEGGCCIIHGMGGKVPDPHMQFLKNTHKKKESYQQTWSFLISVVIYAKIFPLIKGNNFALPYAKSLPIIGERFCVPLRKIFPILPLTVPQVFRVDFLCFLVFFACSESYFLQYSSEKSQSWQECRQVTPHHGCRVKTF